MRGMEKQRGKIDYTLSREVLMANPAPGQGPVGYVSAPLNIGDVREFKKMGKSLDDPIGVAEKLDQFLGTNIYTWVELQSIPGGIREAVPKGQNIGKALNEHQRDESPAEGSEGLRKDLQLYSVIDLDNTAGQVFLKTPFVAKSSVGGHQEEAGKIRGLAGQGCSGIVEGSK